MNAAQAKRIALATLLAQLGNTPVRNLKGDLWYRSPFRHETEASFKINVKENIWYDFGIGQGGNILDFMMQLHDHRDVSQALQDIERLMGKPNPRRDTNTPDLFSQPIKNTIGEHNTLTIRKVQSLQNTALIQYLSRRGIPKAVAAPYVQEMYYTRDDKPYFALAFPNDSGGYELRNPYFKGVQGKKDISLLRTGENATGTLFVFEGFIDFLSALVYQPDSSVLPALVLNSVAMQHRALSVIKASEATTIHLYLDQDEAGRALTQYFQEHFQGRNVIDQSKLYAGNKDLNALITRPDRCI